MIWQYKKSRNVRPIVNITLRKDQVNNDTFLKIMSNNKSIMEKKKDYYSPSNVVVEYNVYPYLEYGV